MDMLRRLISCIIIIIIIIIKTREQFFSCDTLSNARIKSMYVWMDGWMCAMVTDWLFCTEWVQSFIASSRIAEQIGACRPTFHKTILHATKSAFCHLDMPSSTMQLWTTNAKSTIQWSLRPVCRPNIPIYFLVDVTVTSLTSCTRNNYLATNKSRSTS